MVTLETVNRLIKLIEDGKVRYYPISDLRAIFGISEIESREMTHCLILTFSNEKREEIYFGTKEDLEAVMNGLQALREAHAAI